MDEFFLQLSELARAGWSFQISPEPSAPSMPATRAVIVWSRERNEVDPQLDQPVQWPLIDWINLFAPEIELRKAVSEMHSSIFPIPPFGDIPA